MTEAVANAVLAVDLGTSGMKVALVTERGRVLGWESEPVELLLTADGGAEQSPEGWWRALLAASRRLLGRGLVSPVAVRAVCCSTQGEGTVPVDRDGNALMNCILWMDMRGAPYLNARLRGAVNVAGAGVLKVLRYVRLTGGMPSRTGKDPAGHMLLVRERFPEVYEKTFKFLNVLDYLNLRLTGRFVATFDSILTSWVTDNRNPDAIHYDDRLVRQSGIERDKFPEIVACTTPIGTLTRRAADELGLSTEVVVVAGAIDNTAAAIGSGAVADFLPHLYVGTSSWVAAHVPFKKTDPVAGLASVPCAVKSRYLLTALQATAGGNLTFLKDNVLFASDALGQGGAPEDVFVKLNQLARETPPGSNGVLYTPWLWGERAPVEDRSVRAGFYNLSFTSTRADLVRAVMEGVAFNTRWLMRPVNRFMGRSAERMHIAGGGANSEVWCGIFADVLGIPVYQVRDPIQANARGAAFIALAGLKELDLARAGDLVEVQQVHEPNAALRSLYDERFEVFVEIYARTKKIYERLNARLSG